jgi:hypothetical protein
VQLLIALQNEQGFIIFFITTGPGNFVYYSIISKEETIEFFDILKGDREVWRVGGGG